MKNVLKAGFILILFIFLVYIVLPNPGFPIPLSGAIQSNEPADIETTLRRGYYTNLTREEVMSHYIGELNYISVFSIKIPLPTYRLNYPPEEAQTLIRDQARSTFLEEIVHPFRESVLVNGYEPKQPQYRIFTSGKNWRQKIIVRQVSSNVFVRLSIGIMTIFLIYLLTREWIITLYKFRKDKNA